MNATTLLMALALTAPGLKEPPEKTSVVGVWELQSLTNAGIERPAGIPPTRFEFAADGRWYAFRNERLEATQRTYLTNPKASPLHIDLIDDPAEPSSGAVRGIYKIEGDTLTLCLVRNNGPRPTRFKSTAESKALLYVFKRVKD